MYADHSGRLANGGNNLHLVDAIFKWCECLKGQEVVENALSAIAEAVGAEAIALSRIKRGQANWTRQVCFDRNEAKPNGPALDKSFAESLIGEYLGSARSGTIWFRSTVEVDPDPALDLFHSRRKLRELAIIPLATGGTTSDFLEIHFADLLGAEQYALLNTLSGTFAQSWATRAKGVFLENLLNNSGNSGHDEELPLGTDILGVENPFRLSRAEYRVCLLLSRGLPPKGVCRELSITNPTLRTHLRNIYSKTSTVNLAGLLYLLLKGDRGGLDAAHANAA